MLIDFKALRDLPVETESGIMLGHIHNVVLDTDSLSVKQIYVNSNKLIILSDDLLINADQIIAISKDKITVAENVNKILAVEPENKKMTQESVAPISAEAQN